MNEPFIRQRGAQLFTTSIDVAEKFGKRHDHVLRSISKIIAETSGGPAPKNEGGSKVPGLKIGGADFGKQNFRATIYMDEQNQRRPMFEMTRSGFTILAMGFTGKVALEWNVS